MAEFILSILAAVGAFLRSRGDTCATASSSRNQAWRDICDVVGAAVTLLSAGFPFLHNHREAIIEFDFFTVPGVTFQLLYCFFVIEPGRRRIRHFNGTRSPTAEWVVQQSRETFPGADPYRYAILDRDSKFDAGVIDFLEATGLKTMRTSVQASWQNGVSEHWVESCRREILNHVIPSVRNISAGWFEIP